MFNSDLDKKFDGLTLDTEYQQPNTNGSSAAASTTLSFTKKSLLSSSLADERYRQQIAQQDGSKQPFFTLEDTHVHVQAQSLVNSMPTQPIPGRVNPQPIPGRLYSGELYTEHSSRIYTDEHPEPELLASSVGKEIGGRLVPSSSTISLLSLNDHQDMDTAFSTVKTSYQMTSPKFNQFPSENTPLPHAQHGFVQHTQPQLGMIPPFMDRKNSFSNMMLMMSSRNSITHQRLQPYQKFTSPPPTNSAPVSPPMIQLEYYHSLTIPISINKLVVPDSPNLDPTSLGGSPSKFWLSSQTPPRSVAGSLSRNSRLYFQQQHQPQQQPQQLQYPDVQHSVRPMHISLADNYTLTNSVSPRRGMDSPTLEPVQTPSEDLPMTPLYLGTQRLGTDSYFSGFESRGILSPEPPQIHSQLEGIIEMKQSDDEKEDSEMIQ